MKPKITRLENEGTICPSQWDAWTDDGKRVYIRFRHGWLSADFVPEDYPYGDGEEIGITGISASGDGFMDDETMMEYLKDYLDFSGANDG